MAKVTAFLPPANDSLVLELNKEAYKNGCFVLPSTRYCPRIRPYLHHHVMKTVDVPAGQKVKTMAGDKIRWIEMDHQRYLMPAGVKVWGFEKVHNGEVWKIEKSLEA